MNDSTQAAQIAATLFNQGRSVDEVISSLYESGHFEQYRFYEANGFIYMEDDDGRFPAVKVCQAPETSKE